MIEIELIVVCLGLTGNREGVELIITNLELLKTIVMLTMDSNYVIAKDACFSKFKILLF